MYYDALTTSAVRDELSATLLGGRVQSVVQASALIVGMEVYAGRRYPLFLSAETEAAGVWLAEAKIRRGVERVSPFYLLLVKYLRGSRLTTIAQPPHERVLRLAFEGLEGVVALICEMMGRYSNLVLVGADGVILDAIKRVPASRNRYRVVLPSQPYVAPPPQNRPAPAQLNADALCAACAERAGEPLWDALVRAAQGISPLLAREVVYRALGDAEAAHAPSPAECAALVEALATLVQMVETHAWSPCVAYASDEAGRYPVEMAPYALTHCADTEPVASISQAIALVAASQRTWDAYLPVRQRLNALIDAEVGRQQARLAALRRSLPEEGRLETLCTQGNAILALAWKVARGQRELLVELAELGLDEAALPPEARRIALDPALSPGENAQERFREYHKLKAAAERVPPLIAQGEQEPAYLAQLRNDVALAGNRAALDMVEAALIEAGFVPAPKRAKPAPQASQPLRVRAPDGTLIWVGRNSRENEEVTFRRAAPDDLWLHAHGVPGAHVIVKVNADAPHEDTLQQAARLALHYSALRGEPQAVVDCTERRYVRAIKGGRPGMVTYTHERSLVVNDAEGDLSEVE